MEQKIKLSYINIELKIGMQNWRTVYLLSPTKTQLFPEYYRGRLVYRSKGSSKRFSYAQIKKGLIKQTNWIIEDVPEWFLP